MFLSGRPRLRSSAPKAKGSGLWISTCGTGYYCWKFPETSLEHFHGYTEGFKARVKVQGSNVEEKIDVTQRLGEEVAPCADEPRDLKATVRRL